MTRQFRKLAHSLYGCKYHIVFFPKYRYKILQDNVSKYVLQQIYLLSNQKDGVDVLEVNVQGRSCAFGGIDTAEVCGIGVHGLFEREAGLETI